MDGAGVPSSASATSESDRPKTIMVLAATNRPQDLDEALRRRLEKRIYIPLPNEIGRKALFEINSKGVQLDESIDWDNLVSRTEGYSGADISNVCREAAMMPMRRKLLSGSFNIDDMQGFDHKELESPICHEDFLEALQNISKSVSQECL